MSLLPSLNILPKFKEDIMPLWDTNNLNQRNEDCYYEFEIIAKADSTDVETYCSSKVSEGSPCIDTDIQDHILSTNTCFICNIEVPVACMSEHLVSAKHRTFLKIAEISLERVKKQMFANYKSENLPAGFSFCDICVTLIPERDVESHVKLKPHKNAELVDKLLSDLLKIYSDSDVGNDESNVSRLDSSKNSRKLENVGSHDGSGKPNGYASKIIAGSSKADSSKSAGERPDRIINKTITGNCKSNLDSGKTVTSGGRLNINAKAATANGELDAYISKVNNSKLDVPSKSHIVGQSKRKIVNGTGVFDKIPQDSAVEILNCKKVTLAYTPEDKEFNEKIMKSIDGGLNEHISHLNNNNNKIEVGEGNDLVVEISNGLRVRVPLANFHGLYSLGKRHMLCVLCKKIDKDIKKHIFSVHHLNNIRQPINENCVRELLDQKSHCIICNETMEYPASQARCNKDHDIKLKLALVDSETDRPEKSGSFPQKASAPKIKAEDTISVARDSVTRRSYSEAIRNAPRTLSDLDYVEPLLLTGSPEQICSVCYSSFGPADWETHSRSPEHKCNEALIPHHLLEYSTQHKTLKCEVCVMSFPVHYIIQHVSSFIHHNNYRKLLSVHNMTRTGRTVYCSACIAYMDIGHEFVHLTSIKHNALLINTLVSNDLKMEEEEKVVIKPHFCTVCQVNVPGDERNIKAHEDGARHKKNLAHPLIDIGANPKNHQKANIAIANQHGYVVKATSKLYEVECRVCSTILPNTLKNIQEHLLGGSHQFNASALKTETIEVYRDIFWCRKCELQVPAGEQFKHKDSLTHIAKNNVKESTDEEKTKDTESLSAFCLNMLAPTENKGSLCCQVCNVIVPNSGSTLRMHFEGVKHRSQVAKLLKTNGLNAIGLTDEFNCTICTTRFRLVHLLDHIKLRRHIGGLPRTPEYKPPSEQKNQEDKHKPEVTQSNQNDAEPNPKPVENDTVPEVPKVEFCTNTVKLKSEDYHCIVCNVTLTTNEANISVHKDGSRHKTNLRIMDVNKIKIEDAGCYCEACSTKFERENLLQHVGGSQHLMMLG